MPEKTQVYAELATKFIKEVGFPIVAYLLLFYLCMTTMQENTAAVEELTKVIAEL